jgi:translation initiation factor eIF-2B subunit beta
MVNPATVMGYADAALNKHVATCHPLFDYVPPNLVSLFVLNVGSHPPSYIYQMVRDFYHEDEHE